MNFSNQHILSTELFERSDLERLFKIADQMQPYARRESANHVLDGAILSNMFFEASTRTRISFSSAFQLLGGKVNETTGIEHSSIIKGESLYDTARVLSGYSDVIVMRHPEPYSVGQFAKASRVPVINAGDGDNEHPTQALLDLYTIETEIKRHGTNLDDLRIALIGDLKYGRTVHSLCALLCHYRHCCVKLISPSALAMPVEQVEALRKAGLEVVIAEHMHPHIEDVDIVYATRIQEERFENDAETNAYQSLYSLNASIYTRHCSPNTVIMHPMPRNSMQKTSELEDDLNEHPNLAIFRQADNGVLVRMALFALIFDVANQLSQHESPLSWRARRQDKPSKT